MKTDGIIFDLDGTLWNSIQPVTESWNQVIEKKKGKDFCITEDDMHNSMGMRMEDIARKLFPALPDEERLALLRECCEFENGYVAEKGGILFDGLEETLAALQEKAPLFIVSNCQSGYIEAFFKARGLGRYFKDHEDPGRTGLDKAGNIRLVAERNGLRFPVYVGDTQGDCDSSKKAGVPFIFAEYGFGEVKEEDCDGIIRSIRELPGLFL